MTEFETAGEQLAGRELAKEIRAGVPHYVTGQHLAEIIRDTRDFFTDEPGDIGRVTYVDVMGHAIVLLVYRPKGGEWRATWISRAGHQYAPPARRAPEDFELSERVLCALENATDMEIPA